MIRTLAIAALAAATLCAAPASAESITISTVGKTPLQVKAEVLRAARTLCDWEARSTLFYAEDSRACVAETVRTALVDSHDPALMTLAEK